MKMNQTAPVSVDAYIAGFPEDIQAVLQKIRATIRKAAPGAQERISYHMPAFTLDGILVYFAAYKTHIGFYPGSKGIDEFKDELSRYDCAKGTVRFPSGSPIPYGLIARIVKFRVNENRRKAEAKRKKKAGKGGEI